MKLSLTNNLLITLMISSEHISRYVIISATIRTVVQYSYDIPRGFLYSFIFLMFSDIPCCLSRSLKIDNIYLVHYQFIKLFSKQFS